MAEFRMPSLGADMEVGTVLEWLVKPGAEVHRGDIVAVVDTAKAAVEVEVFDDGVVDRILVPAGEQVPVGTPLATLAPIGAAVATEAEAPVPQAAPAVATPEPAPAPPPPPPPSPPALRAAAPLPPPPVRHLAHQRGVDLAAVHGTGPQGAVTRDDVERAGAPRRTRVSPYARRRAAELGLDLATVTGTGQDGLVTVADVEHVAAGEPPLGTAPEPAALPAQPRADAGAPPDRSAAMRSTIAALMARSKREIPHYYLSTTVDLDRATAWLRDTNRERPASARLLPAALLLKAVAVAAREVAGFNGFWRDDEYVPSDAVHLGVAIALRGGGLLAPALHDADRLSLDELMAGLRDLVARSRAGRLRRAELTDATLTVTNLGDLGVEAVYGVVFPPQVALVGIGKVVDRPVAVGGLLGIRPTVTLTLSADHRASYGHVGARFLAAVDRLLQSPEALAAATDVERTQT